MSLGKQPRLYAGPSAATFSALPHMQSSAVLTVRYAHRIGDLWDDMSNSEVGSDTQTADLLSDEDAVSFTGAQLSCSLMHKSAADRTPCMLSYGLTSLRGVRVQTSQSWQTLTLTAARICWTRSMLRTLGRSCRRALRVRLCCIWLMQPSADRSAAPDAASQLHGNFSVGSRGSATAQHADSHGRSPDPHCSLPRIRLQMRSSPSRPGECLVAPSSRPAWSATLLACSAPLCLRSQLPDSACPSSVCTAAACRRKIDAWPRAGTASRRGPT